MIKKRILDIGASANPDIRATDAIDGATKKGVEHWYKTWLKPHYEGELRNRKNRKVKLPKPQTNNKIKMLYNIDFTKDKLPYTDNSIDIIISNNSLSKFGNTSHNTKELYRILKPGGHIDIGFEMPSKYISRDDAYKKLMGPILTPIALKKFAEISNKKIKEEMKYYKNTIDNVSKYLKNNGFKDVKVIKNAKDYTLCRHQFNKVSTVVRAYK